jgi:hypothetical protein
VSWTQPTNLRRTLRADGESSCPIVKISFGELGRMVSLARCENQALMGYLKK